MSSNLIQTLLFVRMYKAFRSLGYNYSYIKALTPKGQKKIIFLPIEYH